MDVEEDNHRKTSNFYGGANISMGGRGTNSQISSINSKYTQRGEIGKSDKYQMLTNSALDTPANKTFGIKVGKGNTVGVNYNGSTKYLKQYEDKRGIYVNLGGRRMYLPNNYLK